jgi:hypothetical protein
MDITLPNLPPSFYDEHANLRHVLQAARHHITPPDVVLAAVLSRIATTIPVTSTIHRSPMNYIVAYVGESGTGKTTGQAVAKRLVPDVGTELDGIGIGSGEGIIQSYLQEQKVENDYGDKVTQNVQVHKAALFYVDEGEHLLTVGKREGSTTMPILRNAWSGQLLGTSGAKSSTTRRLLDNTYRFVLGVGIQPNYAVQLLAGKDAGTPQRFVWAYARDPYVPNGPPPSFPSILELTPPTPSAFRIDNDIRDLVQTRQRDVLRSGKHNDEYESHFTQLQLRTAVLLGLLCGTDGTVNAFTWNLSAQYLEVSNNIRKALQEYAAMTQRQQVRDKNVEYVENYLERDQLKDERGTDRIARLIGKHVNEKHVPRHTERSRLHGRDRVLFDDALERAVEHGYVTIVIQSDNSQELQRGPNPVVT